MFSQEMSAIGRLFTIQRLAASLLINIRVVKSYVPVFIYYYSAILTVSPDCRGTLDNVNRITFRMKNWDRQPACLERWRHRRVQADAQI